MSVPSSSPQGAVDGGDDQPPPKKKQCASKIKVSLGRFPPKGKLSLLLTMLSDILVEVFSWLLPLDLLHLGRSSKHLRSILMSKASQSMWSSSRRNVPAHQNLPFPELPADMSEPAYASLVFEHWCMMCKESATHFDFCCRERICARCRGKKRYSRGKGLSRFIEVCEISGVSIDVVRIIYSLLPVSAREQFCIPVAQNIYRQCMIRKSQLGSVAFMEYLAERQAAVRAIGTQHGDRLTLWHQYRQMWARCAPGSWEDRREAAQQIRAERVKHIIEKLAELGWSEKDFPLPDSENYNRWVKITIQAKPLTAQAWGSLKLVLVPLLAAEKASRALQGRIGGDISSKAVISASSGTSW